MVKLTDYEQSMLEGQMGAFKQKALEFIVRYAEVLGAEELCEFSRATLFIGAHHYLDCYPEDTDYQKIFSEFYLCSDELVEFGKMADGCKVQTCAGACDFREYERSHLLQEYHEKNLRFLETTKKMGVKIVESCTPYYVGWIPLQGEHFVTNESSNVVVSNTVFGAYGNSDGVEAAVCGAICGRIPKWGMHIKENRYGTCVFTLASKTPESFVDWDLLGFTMGRLLPKHQVPVLLADFKRPDINKLRQFCSAISVTSATELCHIVGLTPEAQTLEMALGGKTPKYEIVVTQKDIEESLVMLCDEGEGEVDFIHVGCPHLSLDELKDIAEYICNKKVKEGVEFAIWTDYATKEMANVNGYTQIIEDAGAFVLAGSCPVVMREHSHRHATAMVMSGAKQACSIRHQTKVPVYYGGIYECIDAAIKGRWEGVK